MVAVRLRRLCLAGMAALTLAACGTPVVEDDLPGVYHANYGSSRNTLMLLDDGTYEETYVYRDGASHHNTGTWHAETHSSKLEVILDDAIVFDFMTGRPRERMWQLTAHRSLRGTITLEMENDPDGVVRLVKEQS